MEETAYAKINLALHVRAREPDGYHSIETLFAFAEDGDRLSVSEAPDIRLQATGPFAAQMGPCEDNLVLKAAEAVRSRYGIGRGAALTLEKNLPIASGIGGGSADAAAALRLLTRWWDIPTDEDTLFEISRGLGADVSACLRSEVARGTGRGDILASQDGSGLAAMPLLLVNPGIALSTAAVFAGWSGIDGGPLPTQSSLAAAVEGRNDLEAPARVLAPQIGEVLTALGEASGVFLSRMSGSGATCFALFARPEDRDAAAAAIAQRHPDWWLLATRLR